MGFKIEAGKYYRTRDGKKAFVAGINGKDFKSVGKDWCAIGWIEGVHDACGWNEEGETHSNRCHLGDLVAEWKEPKRIKGWVNVYAGERPGYSCAHRKCDAHPGTGIFECKESADKQAANSSKRRIACIQIDVLEGEGLQ